MGNRSVILKKLFVKTHSIRDDGERISPTGFGLCDSCIHFEFRATIYGDESVTYTQYDTRNIRGLHQPSRVNPISMCSSYYEKGRMTLKEMMEIATLINVKRDIGFGLPTDIESLPPDEEERVDPDED